MQKIIWLPLAAAVFLAAVVVYRGYPPASEQPPDTTGEPTVIWHSCDPIIYSDRAIKCGRFYPGGEAGEFFMPLAVFQYAGEDAAPEPLVYIAGGPGGGMQTEAENLQGWSYWLEDAGLKRDLIIYDQRGLKPGEPYWVCEAYNALNIRLIAEDLTLEQEYQRTAPVLDQCLEAFHEWLQALPGGASAGIGSFNSIKAAEDLNHMLRAAGYEQWNLWGVSYGTRLALVTAQQAPQRVNRLVLDSPYPLDKGALSARPAAYAKALQVFWQRCTDNADLCGTAVADPEALFWRVAKQLKQNPQVYRIRTAGQGPSLSVVLNDHRLFSLALFALYDHRLYPELLRALVFLYEGAVIGPTAEQSPDPVKFLLTLFIASALDEDFNSLIFYAIECNDNPLETPEAYREAALAHPAIYAFTAWEGEYNPCRSPLFEPDGLLSPEPVPAAPALVLTGELDPVTPVAWAQTLAMHLPEAHLVVVPGISHAVLSSGGCDAPLIEAFLQVPAGTELQLPSLASMSEKPEKRTTMQTAAENLTQRYCR